MKTLTVSWQWSGDKYSLRGFNLAVTPTAKNPKEEVVATAFVETNEIKQTYSYKMGNVTLDKDAQYKIWVQAVYENSDSNWVSTGGATVTDDGSATIITKTDREIQDIANMASDNILTRQEKVGLRREWQEIVYEFLEIESTAVGQGIPSSNTALSNFKSKGNALGTYLNGGTAWTISSSNKTSFPLWINDSNLGSNTSINGNTYRETFRAYYEAKVKILEEIGTHKIDNVQIGATNIIRNSSNPKTLTHWKSDTGFSVAKSELLGENVFRILTTDATEKYGATNRYKVEPNCQYTFAMDVYMDANVTSLDVFWLSRAKGSTSDYDSATQFIQAWKDTKSKWVRITGTFTTKATDYEGYIRIDNNGTTNSTTLNGLWFTKVKLEKGNKPTDWSPALEDMENAYTIVLTNEAQVIPTNSSRVPTSSTVYHTDIQVYQGTTQRTDYTIGTVNSANGITVSKTSSRVSFSVSTETALTVDGGNFAIPITIDGKTFNKTFSWSCSKQGNVGDSGVGISSITEYYAVSSSNTTAPTSWSTTVPTMTSTNKYLWNYEAIKYTNNTTKETAKRVIGAYGDKGATGGTGATGNGISNITNYYLATSSSSGVTTSTSGWTTSVQVVSASKKYLWNYEVVTYTNGSTSTTTPCIIGTYGDKGDKGDNAKNVTLTATSQVFKSTDGGKNFTPDSITIKPTYQNVSHSKWQHSLDGGKTWVDTGTNTNGVTIDGNGFTISKSSTLFTDNITSIVVKDVTNDSSVYDTITITRLYDVTDIEIGGTNLAIGTNQGSARWGWGLQQGDRIISSEIIDGINCVKLEKGTATPHSGWNYVSYSKFARDKITPNTTYTASFEIKSNKTFDVGSIDLKYGDSTNTLIASSKAVKKSVKANSDWTKIIFELKTKDVLPTTAGQVIYITGISATNGNIHYIRNLQLEKGNKATDWSPAVEDLENAYTIVLTNEAQVIPTNSSRVPTSSTTYHTDIQVYQGTTQRTDYTIGTINSANGITVSKTSSRVNFAVSTETTITADGGNFTIPITIDGKTFNKTFSWSCSKQGNTGATGNAGQDAITIVLSNENHTFPCESNGNIPTALSTTCVVTAYKGASSVTPTIGSITNPTGMTVTVNKTTLTIQANKGTSLADSGTVNIPITVDGKTFNKTFSWSKAKKGDIGNKGDGAKTADIIASSQVFKSTDGGLTFSPTTITMTPKLQNVTYSNWQYSTNGGSTWNGFTNSISGWSVSSGVLTINKDCSLFTTAVTSVVFRLNTNDSSVYDTITIVKLYDVTEVVIGGRNLISKNYVSTNNSTGSFDSATNTWNLTATAGAGGTWGCGLVLTGKKILIPYGKTYVLSFEIKVPRNCSWNADVNNYAVSGSSWSGNDNDEGAKRKTSSKSLVANQWVKCWVLWANTSSSNTNKVDLYDNTNFGVIMKDDTSNMTFQIRNVKGELGTAPTDWSPCPDDVKDYADQTAQNAVDAQTQASIFNKLTNNGQTQGIYLENSKIYINGEYIKASSITADRLAIGDFNNLCQIHPSMNANNLTVITTGDVKYFKIGQGAYSTLQIAKSTSLDFSVGDEYFVSYKGYRESGVSSVAFIIRYRYSDGTWTNAGTVAMTPNTSTGTKTATCKITNAPTSGKHLSHIQFFFEKDSGTSGYYYLTDIQVLRKGKGSLIVDGTITANMITSGTFKGTNFIAGGSSSNGYVEVLDSSNNLIFKAQKGGVVSRKITFVNDVNSGFGSSTPIVTSIDQEGINMGYRTGVSSDGFSTSYDKETRYASDEVRMSYRTRSQNDATGSTTYQKEEGMSLTPKTVTFEVLADDGSGTITTGLFKKSAMARGTANTYQAGISVGYWDSLMIGSSLDSMGDGAIGRGAGEEIFMEIDSNSLTLHNGVQLSNSSDGDRLKIQGRYGNVTIGSYNTDWCHFNTDRPKFYFDKQVSVCGEIYAGGGYDQRVYHQGWSPKSGNYWSGGAAFVNTDGVMEIGKYIDFHNSNNGTEDYSVRLCVDANNKNTVYLPNDNGRLYNTGNHGCKRLANGAWYMNGGQSVGLSDTIWNQAHGIVLVFSAYNPSSGQTYQFDWHTYFVPKTFFTDRESAEGYVLITTFLTNPTLNNIGTKHIRVYNNRVTGDDRNVQSGSGSGISFKNNEWVLRYVYGV